MAEVNIQSMTAEEIEEYMRGFGEFLARLLHASDLSDEHKAAWEVLVPEMTLDQLGRFAAVLERSVDPTKQPEVAELRKNLQKVKDEYDAKMQSLGEEAQAGINSIMKEVKAAEAAAKSVE